MTDCLASTGADFSTLLFVAIALLLAGGVALATARRRANVMMLAIIPLAIAGMLLSQAGPVASYAATDGCSTEVSPQTPIVVTTVDPTIVAGECDVSEDTVTPAETPGVIYTVSRVGTIVTVTATAAPGYVLDATAITTWSFDVAIKSCGGGGTGRRD